MYKTKQKDIIYNILENNKDKQLSISQIKNICENSNINIGLTTIYRILNNLDSENLLIKTIKQNGEAEYQLRNSTCNEHIHIKCQKCGNLTHLDHKTTTSLIKDINKNYNMNLNLISSHLIGTCNKCKQGK